MTGLVRAAIAKALTSLALFGVAMPLKYWAGVPQAVSMVGPFHGVAFVARSWGGGLVNWLGALRLFIGALIPFGGLVNERWLRRQCEHI